MERQAVPGWVVEMSARWGAVASMDQFWTTKTTRTGLPTPSCASPVALCVAAG